MTRGAPPIPAAVKQARGNPGRRPINEREPKPAVGLPPCPPYFGDDGRRLWGQLGAALLKLGVLTTIDGTALELLCTAYEDWRKARQVIETQGWTYETNTAHGVIVRQRPEVQQADAARKTLRALLSDFGLTPSSRSRLVAMPPGELPLGPGTEAKDEFESFVNT